MGSEIADRAPARDAHGHVLGTGEQTPTLDLSGVDVQRAFAAGRALESLRNHLVFASEARRQMRLQLERLAVTPSLCRMVGKVANQLASVETLLRDIQLTVQEYTSGPVDVPADVASVDPAASEAKPEAPMEATPRRYPPH